MKDPNANWKPGDPIGYINPAIPSVDLKPTCGERYEASVPDTLDLAERARLAVNALTEVTDPQADYEPYYIVTFRSNPPQMFHNCWHTGGMAGKFLWALILARLASGSEQNMHVQQRWMENALKMQGKDGLIYVPRTGRPWLHVWYPPASLDAAKALCDAYGGQELTPLGNATMLTAFVSLATLNGSQVWRDAARRLAKAMIKLIVERDDMAYVWPTVMAAARDVPHDHAVPNAPFECEGTMIPHALVHAYRALGYAPALKLARKYFNFLRKHFYGKDGMFVSADGRVEMCHFHAHARGILAMLEYTEAAGDSEMLGFVKGAFEYARGLARNQGIDPSYRVVRYPGADLIGFFPEWANCTSEQMHGETCQATDMIGLALRLSEAGAGDYWDDADRWIRNHLAESQLLTSGWIYKIQGGPPSPVEPYGTTDRVPERNIGSFAGSPDPNDWYSGHHYHGIGHCCTATGARVLYWAWERILRYHNGKLRVNLLLNRASVWADVDSYIPYQGRVDVKVKKPVDLSMRIPEWVKPAEARCQVNDCDRTLDFDGRYAHVGDVKPGDTVMLSFPIAEQTNSVQIEKRVFTFVRKGNEVVSVEPPGKYFPTYQRQHYRTGEPRFIKVTRFIPERTIKW